MTGLILALVLTAVGALVPALALAQPNDLFGVVTQGPLTSRDYARMGNANVATLRFGLWWYQAEPEPGVYDWSYVDSIMRGAASAGVEPLPFVYGTPAWLAAQPAVAPVATAHERRAWQRFLRAAARRYGPDGSFWHAPGPAAPVHIWQIWNEPNFPLYWRPHPSAPEYASLVALSDRAIESVDAGARVMLAGVAPVRGGVEPWQYLEQLYQQPGVRGHFDAVALHPYSPSLYGIKYQLRLVRRVMDASGDARTPLAITELGWASGGARDHALVRTPAGQARMLTRAFAYLQRTRARWRLSGVSWYSWRDTNVTAESLCDFCKHSGLFTLRGNPKPAWSAFRRMTAP